MMNEDKTNAIPIAKSPFENLDLYGILEVDRSANEAAIRRAYKRGALKYHPGMYL